LLFFCLYIASTSISQASQLENPRALGFSTVGSTQQRCFVCKSIDGRGRVPKNACLDLFQIKRIFVNEDRVRCCRDHLDNGFFTKEAMDMIQTTNDAVQLSGETEIAFIYFLT